MELHKYVKMVYAKMVLGQHIAMENPLIHLMIPQTVVRVVSYAALASSVVVADV